MTSEPSAPVLVIDAGSHAIRCLLVEDSRRVVRAVSADWAWDDADGGALSRAFDLDAVWQTLRNAATECVGDASPLAAVAVSSQRQSLVILDSAGDAVYAGANADMRALMSGAALDAERGELLYRVTGHRPAFMLAAGKLAWLRDARPQDYARVANALPLADWIAYRLCDDIGVEPTLAAACGLLDARARIWASDMFAALGLECPPAPIREPLTVRGKVSARGMESARGAPVVVAGGDTQCALIGMGVWQPGEAGAVVGWSASAMTPTDAPLLPPEMRTWTGLLQTPRTWTLESGAGDVGGAWQWLVETLCGGEADYARVDAMAESALAAEGGAGDLVAAHLGPAAMDMSALGMRMGGLLFPTPMTLGGPSPARLAIAALESFAFALRANIEQLERGGGSAISRVAVCGGMTRTRAFTRILPNALGREIELADADSTALGAAIIARAAIAGVPLADAIRQTARAARPIRPNPQAAAECEARYRRWADLQSRLGDLPLN